MTKLPAALMKSARMGLGVPATSSSGTVPRVVRYGPSGRSRLTMTPVTPAAASRTASRPQRYASSASSRLRRSEAAICSDWTTWNSPRTPSRSLNMRWITIATLAPPMAPNSTFWKGSLVVEPDTGRPLA